MEDKKVSIITPCFNGEGFAERFFNNILGQTYQNIELIFVNDGSSDRTEAIAKSYIPTFEQSGRKLIYIYQENSGQAEAMNKGLAIFSGDYLMWTDSDDILDKDNIRKKVEFLEQNPDCGYVMCYAQEVHESDLTKKIGDLRRIQPHGEDNIFEDVILEKNIVYTPGVYMARTEAILGAIPSRHIMKSDVGQNWQMLMPLTYKYKCGYIKEVLFSYVIREDSHSRREKKLEDVIEKLHKQNDLIACVLKEMGLENSKYMDMLKDKVVRKEFDNGYFFKDKQLMKQKYKELKDMGRCTRRDTLILWSGLCPVIDVLYSIFKMAKRAYRRR
ncbi:glycosyltransferase family A protein [Butyrivibrio sp. JL13D10]|uniref:glycosyltransferase family A protein n=1 Tax=Butyrivibrio sp. JL13D10 TaxID=3236815 RepID=UPI0038B4EB6F